jgi:hypothetical protein
VPTNLKISARAPWHPVEGLPSMDLGSQRPVNDLPGGRFMTVASGLPTDVSTAPRPTASLTSTPSWAMAP